ncbi:MAG: rhodanese-like domain-containing protein [Oscillospiraceae bacterium]|jgi:rhodanese-related sulfurtransferase|nr:rhodanese-like domain-containing protein [Oscillospiraceae bacterium]
MNKRITTLILLLSFVVLSGCPANDNTDSTIISGADAKKLYESDGNTVLLDVRTQDEFDAYHIEGSVLIPIDELESRLSELPDKSVPIIVFCKAGIRSERAAEILSAHGYTNIHDMQTVDRWE